MRLLEGADDMWSVGLFPGRNDVLSKVQVLLLAGRPIEQDNRFQNRGRGHTNVGPSRNDALLARAKSIAKQIPNASRAGKRLLITRVLIVREESQNVVLVHPNVPIRVREQPEPLFRNV